MKSFNDSMIEYKKQIQKGDIKQAYQGLMEYIMKLRAHFEQKYPDYYVSGSIYFGYMDMTYFSFSPESLKQRKLKVAIVFCHDSFRFEVWLAGYNKQVQTKYWKLFRESNWSKYHIPATLIGVDSIVENVLVEEPDFVDLDKLTNKIESNTLSFITDIENFLTKH